MVEPKSRHRQFERALRQAEWNVEQLWLSTLASGGTTSLFDLEAFLYGLGALPPAQQDVVASALNERLDDLYKAAKIPYLIAPSDPDPPAEDPLAVLAEHLRAARGSRQETPPLPPG